MCRLKGYVVIINEANRFVERCAVFERSLCEIKLGHLRDSLFEGYCLVNLRVDVFHNFPLIGHCGPCYLEAYG